VESGSEQQEVEFKVSDEAAAQIRARGRRVWIFPDADRWPHATIGKPFHDAEWVTFEREGLVVHVDSAIVPPKRWVLGVFPGSSTVVASWNGLDPKLFGRLPLVRPDEEPVEQPSSPLAHVRKFLLVPGLAWVFALFWALHYVGVRSDWLWIVQVAVLVVLALVARAIWLREKLRERRADRASESAGSLL
jgi:hypothetical protein